MVKKKVLLLGGTGRIGPGLVEEYLKNYSKDYDLILGYHRKKPSFDKIRYVKVDLGRVDSLKKAFKGVSVVINLAANSNADAKFNDILEPNIVGAYNVFEAARLAKVKRVVFASSVHAIKGYPHDYRVSAKDNPMPLDLYGASKVFGEALCKVFSTKYGLSCLAIRIGAYVSDDKKEIACYSRTDYDYAISQRDFAQLVHKCVIARDNLKYGIFSGISNDEHKRLELKHTRRILGYKPKDDLFEVCRDIKNLEKVGKRGR